MRLSKLEAAMRLGVSPSTVDRMIQRGQLEAEKEPHGTRALRGQLQSLGPLG